MTPRNGLQSVQPPVGMGTLEGQHESPGNPHLPRRGRAAASSGIKFPIGFLEVVGIVHGIYTRNNKGPDGLIEILKDLSRFTLFWADGSEQSRIDRLTERILVIDLYQLSVLKELVVYLVIERLYKKMAALPDSQIRDGCRELRTILVIDKAHNYLSQKNPFLQKNIREDRSEGVVVLFASRSPNGYTQEFFVFMGLLEFSLIFQCEGVTPTAVQRLLGRSARTARDLQIEMARLRPFQVISNAMGEDRDFTKFKAQAAFTAYR